MIEPLMRRGLENIQEYELFKMQQGEIIADVEKQFTDIVNNLNLIYATSDASKFRNLVLKSEGYVTFGDNNKGMILGCGDIEILLLLSFIIYFMLRG